MKHLGCGHQYTIMMEHFTYMVAIDIGNGQQRDTDEMPCPTYPCMSNLLLQNTEILAGTRLNVGHISSLQQHSPPMTVTHVL